MGKVHERMTVGMSEGMEVAIFLCVYYTQSDCLTDPSQPKKLKFLKFLAESTGLAETDSPRMHCTSAPCKVNGNSQQTVPI